MSRLIQIDLLYIALNFYGFQTALEGKRFRFLISPLNERDHPFYFDGFPNDKSPFRLEGNGIWLSNELIFNVEMFQRDNVVLAYARNNGTVLTFNPNSRSSCTGCKFCYTTFESPDDRYFQDGLHSNPYDRFFEIALDQLGAADLSKYDSICCSTGCFNDEESACLNIIMMYDAAERFKFKGQFKFLSSTLRSKDAFAMIKDHLPSFQYICTVDCIENRDKYLKASKASMRREDIASVFMNCKTYGHDLNYTYIAGLDSIAAADAFARDVAPFITCFPIIQVFQPHNLIMRKLVHSEARDLTYFLDLRHVYEQLYLNTQMRPRSWENYRSLWYTNFAGEIKSECRI